MNQCWIEMARQIKTFKRKLRKVEACISNKEIKEEPTSMPLFVSTHNEIQKFCESTDPLDHKDLIRNLSLIIAEGRLEPNSNDFNKICRLVRELMPFYYLSSLYTQNDTVNFMKSMPNDPASHSNQSSSINKENSSSRYHSNCEEALNLQNLYCLCDEKGSISESFKAPDKIEEDNTKKSIADPVCSQQPSSLNDICTYLNTNSS